MPKRYTADYRNSNRLYFRSIVELDSEGWSVHILDLGEIDKRTNGPKDAYHTFVEGPDAGKATAHVMLAHILRRKSLPVKPLTWKELN